MIRPIQIYPATHHTPLGHNSVRLQSLQSIQYRSLADHKSLLSFGVFEPSFICGTGSILIVRLNSITFAGHLEGEKLSDNQLSSAVSGFS